MKPHSFRYHARLAAFLPFMILAGCQSENDTENAYETLRSPQMATSDNDANQAVPEPELTTADQEALYFMLEEEKLARDVYQYLGALWNHNTFANIEESERNHVNAVIGLMEAYSLDYELAEAGTFLNPDLQELYDALIASGETDLGSALTVGARIEDLDINDLEEYLGKTSNSLLLDVFSSLQCGSRNHLRAFTGALETLGLTYDPEFISQEGYEEILDGEREQCN